MKNLWNLSPFQKQSLNPRLSIYVILAVMAVSFAFYSSNKDGISKENLQIIMGTKEYTIELAEAMPAEHYSFRPHDSVRSFGEQMAHIGMSTPFMLDLFVNGEPMPSDPAVFEEVAKMEKNAGQSKEECIKMLHEAFDKLLNLCKSADESLLNSEFTMPFDPRQPSFSKASGIEFINDHIIHHRSQALVSLRMQGIAAPQFRMYVLE